MFEIHCPYCDEKRPEIEFSYAGEAHYVQRWWHNAGCNMFFNAIRDTVSDKFVMTYKMGKPRRTPAQIEKAKTSKIDGAAS